jgi:hypothetical protein
MYLTTYPPAQLNKLHINFYDGAIYNLMQKVGVDCLMHRGQYLGTINNAFFGNYSDDEVESTSSVETKMTQFYRLFVAIYGIRKKYCRAIYTEDASIMISKRHKDNIQTLMIQYGLNSEDYADNNDDDEEARSAEDDEEEPFKIPLPDKKKSAIRPEIIKCLLFMVEKRSESVLYKTLEYALINCLNLQCFKLSYAGSTGCKIKATPYNNIDGKTRDISTTAQDNFKTIKMKIVCSLTKFIGLIIDVFT